MSTLLPNRKGRCMPLAQDVTLENFEGPLDLLLHLIQKEEIDIYDVHLQKITEQFLNTSQENLELKVDKGAEFLDITTTLLLIKSQKLLPYSSREPEELLPSQLHLFQQLIEYCRFKEISKILSTKETLQNQLYSRGLYQPSPPSSELSQFQGVNLDKLTVAFQELIKKRTPHSSKEIEAENFQISDKMIQIKDFLSQSPNTPSLSQLFSFQQSKLECIVLFLALLELMKRGSIHVTYENEQYILNSR